MGMGPSPLETLRTASSQLQSLIELQMRTQPNNASELLLVGDKLADPKEMKECKRKRKEKKTILCLVKSSRLTEENKLLN